MRNFLQIGTTDTVPLLQQLFAKPDLWKADTYLRDYPQGPFGDTETVFIRFPPASVTELERNSRDQHECVWMDGATHCPAALPIVRMLAGRVEAERIGRVMINKLRPGGKIFAHADTPTHADYWDRYHVVLQTGKGCTFRCGTETHHMQAGTVWWFQNAIEHETVNASDVDRIHMVIDLRLFRVAAGVTPSKVDNEH